MPVFVRHPDALESSENAWGLSSKVVFTASAETNIGADFKDLA